MSKKIRFSDKETVVPPILEHFSERFEESPREKEILDAYLIDNNVTRGTLLTLLKIDCSEAQRLYLVENYIEEHCPWVELDYMESMWDYLGVDKYDSRNGRCVFFDKIPYASIYNYHKEKDLICDRIRKNKSFILSLK